MDKLRKCVAGIVTYADFKDCRVFKPKLECTQAMKEYVSCMQRNQGRKPDRYEPEYCEEERYLYKLCRDEVKGVVDDDNDE